MVQEVCFPFGDPAPALHFQSTTRARASRRRNVAGCSLLTNASPPPPPLHPHLPHHAACPRGRVYNRYKMREALRAVHKLRCGGKRLVLNFRCGLSNYKYHGAVASVNGKKKDEIDAGRATGFGFALCV